MKNKKFKEFLKRCIAEVITEPESSIKKDVGVKQNIQQIIKECISEVFMENLGSPALQVKKDLYPKLKQLGFRQLGYTPNEYMEYYVNGFATVACSVRVGENIVRIERYYDSERLADNNKTETIPIPSPYSPTFVEKIATVCQRWKKAIVGDESIFGGIDDVSEGFDPQSNAGPNPAAGEQTQDNPYEKWNLEMSKLEEDGKDKNKVTCQKCKGQGHHTMKLTNRSGKNQYGDNTQIVPCDAPGCHNGIVDPDEYYRALGVKENEHGRYAQTAGAGQFDSRTFEVNEWEKVDAERRKRQLAVRPPGHDTKMIKKRSDQMAQDMVANMTKQYKSGQS